jgi:hypothetical protein
VENVLFNWKPNNAVLIDEVEMPQFYFKTEPTIAVCTQKFKYGTGK